MEDQLIKSLKTLKTLKPEEGFVKKSRHIVLSAPQKQWTLGTVLESFKLATALTLASALLFLAFGGISFLNGAKNAAGLLADQKEAIPHPKDFYIQLGEVRYDLNSDKELGAKIEKLLESELNLH